ncbi:MAG: tetratricopeptide repeat protein [Woeseiaceae bacterium]
MTVDAMSRGWRMWQELSKRRVFRVAGIYAFFGWTVLQVADVVLRPIGFPDWAMTVLVWLVVLGFPITLILGWRYQLTPDGMVRRHSVAEDDDDLKLHVIDYALMAGLVAIVGFVATGLVQNVSEPPEPISTISFPQGSIAVLPFEDLSPEQDQQYLAEGIADTLIHRLGQYPTLRVTARTSSFAFQDRDVDVREIAQSLNSGIILEGTLVKADERFRVTVRLIDGLTGQQVMSENFNRTVDDIFLLQDDIANSVTRLPQLFAEIEPANAATDAPGNFRSYELYILGRHHWHRRTSESLRTAIDYFEQAVRQDPAYALAWTGLADSYALLSQYGNIPLENVYESAKAAIDRAFSLNPNLAEAHASRGLLAYFDDDYPSADASLKRAIELNPNYPMAHVWLGRSLYLRSRFSEAHVHFSKAVELDPQQPITVLNIGLTNLQLGKIEAAKEAYLRILEIDPGFPNAYWGLGNIYWLQGRMDLAAINLLKGIDLGLEQWDALLILSGAYTDLGRFEDAQDILDQAVERNGGSNYWTTQTGLYLAQVSGRFPLHAEQAVGFLEENDEGAAALRRAGFSMTLQNRFDDALSYFEHADSLSDPMTGKFEYWSHIWGRMPPVDRAQAELKTGNAEIATVRLEEAIQTWKQNQANDIFNIPVFLYMEACIHALLGDNEQALQTLRDAYDNGWRRAAWARIDPKLEALHEDSGFNELMLAIEDDISAQNLSLDEYLAGKNMAAVFD